MLNRIIIMGRLTRDPELRRTQNGIPVTSFRLAVDRDFKSPNGERETDFIDVVAWRSTAEFVAKYFAKGRMAIVEGRLQIRDWTDQDGSKHKNAEVVADNVRFGETKRDAYGEGGAPSYGGGSGYGGYGGASAYNGNGSGYGGSGYGNGAASGYASSAAPASGYASAPAPASGYASAPAPASGYSNGAAPASGYSNGAAPASGYGSAPAPAPGYSNGTTPPPGYTSTPPAAAASEFSEISEEDGDLPF